jgi:citronellol/citronellal dehydrogenase
MPYGSVFRPGLFDGQTVMVTGGGSGIGRCTAHELAALGAHVVLVGRDTAKLETVVGEITDDGGDVDSQVCDIRDSDAVARTVGAVVDGRGRIHGLVNNAGGQFSAPLDEITDNGFDAVIRTNLHGTFTMSLEVYRRSMRDHGGAIVNMGAAMRNGMPTMGHSGAARAGVINLTMTAAVEWAPAGVRVNAVAPGWIVSSGFDTYEGETRTRFRVLRHAVPLKRLGKEAEVSAAIVFLLSPAAAFISGTTITIDGGSQLASANWPMPDHHRSRPFDGFHRSITPQALKET